MSPSLRRLLKEASELSSSPSPYFHAHPVSDSNLYDWHFTLAGPPAPSPYAHGIYHGRIVLPPTYPLRPPSFRFLTPSGRFEVNREICLSISGHHEETWQPAWGIRTALLALRSFMDAEAKGQVGGLDAPEEVRRELAGRSRGWVCEVCEGRRSNEEVLREWRKVCEESGVVVAEDEGEGESKGEDEGEGEVTAPEVVSEEDSAAPTQTPALLATEEQQPPPSTTSSNPSSAAAAASSPPPPSSDHANPAPPAPTPTIPLPVPAAAAAQSQSSDSSWLDRAILGVLIALVVMIIRRMARTDDI
ncbi:ubiquitin-conjugating enzyme E2 [Aspergillus clavatus NRRL 1]|uniref:Ubiquitin conjugating enzyme (UbcF), putative n=1 Tax=Aspergillus clavatus (strain ATCC 1007 / CBS 513.65 / DSM 816 / NCTC 3887 / NRRL 1 / QM 1276 / 107) TaxID=344612 RepID=A1C7X8_ASPCL|nr:ubiquitin conjugating enzyme (UbcF), putative [Aspergillus clavatus NRRL 1]EAW14499.1 ubiquitin conjugating enzyme (UbcF), putative [Aspergillus clavatus NRRL 1]